MADLTVINPNNLSGILNTNHVATASDRFAVTRGRKYLLRINNAHSAPQTVTLDDPNSVDPGGAHPTAFNPDVVITTANATTKGFEVDADRFADANGWVNLTNQVLGVMNLEVWGPL